MIYTGWCWVGQGGCLAQEIYAAKSGNALMSFTLRVQNPQGGYNNLLGQAYFFHTTLPREAVFLIQVLTNVPPAYKINPNGHWYVGRDVSCLNSRMRSC